MKDDKLKRRSQTDPENKMRMMAILIRNEEAFKTVQDHLSKEMFPPHDTLYAVLWQAVLDFYEEHNELPDYELVTAEIQAKIAEESDLLNDTEVEELDQFLEWAFDEDSFKSGKVNGKTYTNWCVNAAKAFMQEQVAFSTRELVHKDNTVPADLPTLLSEQRLKSEEIATIALGAAKMAFPDKWDETAGIDLVTTGVPFLDRFLGGGHAGGELYGVLGPYGSCKTTLALMLLVEGARSFKAKVSKDGYDGKIPLAFMISYETRTPEMQSRTVGYAARVQRRSLEAMKSLQDLSKSGELHGYEKKIFRRKLAAGRKIMGELGRVEQATQWMNPHVVFVDMTGYDEDHRTAGGGGLKEIARRITMELRGRPDTCCGLVIIDYVGAMVKRQMAADDIQSDQMRHMISNAPLSAKAMIGDQFDCPIWLMHQLSGEANARGEGAKMHHTDSGEAKNFGENLHFALVLGNPNRDNLCTLACTKHRRQPPRDSTIIKIDGAMNRVLDMDGKYVLDVSTRRIMSMSEQSRMPTFLEGAPGGAATTDDVTLDT